MLAEIRTGLYAEKWIAENEAGRPWFDQRRKEERAHSNERIQKPILYGLDSKRKRIDDHDHLILGEADILGIIT